MSICGFVCSNVQETMVRRFFDFFLLAALFFAVTLGAAAQTSLKYQKPPQAIVDIVDARLTPRVEISPGDGLRGRWLLVEAISGLPPIADLAQPDGFLLHEKYFYDTLAAY